jgi:two-component system CheB/CheR fusion protein
VSLKPVRKKTQQEPAEMESTLPAETQDDTTIVAIGASAGGIEALTDLMNHLPSDTGLAFVLV